MENQHYHEQYDEISLKELLTALWSQRLLIVIITVLVIALALIYNFFVASTVYQATSEMIIEPPSETATRYGTYHFPSENPADYINYIKSNEVARKVIEKESLDSTVAGFQNSIEIEQDKDANRFLITTSAGDSEKAVSINNTLINTFINTQRITYKQYAIDRFINNYELTIDNLKLSIESNQRLIDERKALLDNIEPIFTLQKSLFSDPETAAAYADKFDLDLNSLSQAMLVEENARDIYLKIEEGYINTENELINLKESLYNSEERLAELKDEKSFLISNQHTDNAYMILNGKVDVFADKILLVSPALAPENPVAPRKALNLAIGAVLGLMLGVFVGLFVNYWKNS